MDTKYYYVCEWVDERDNEADYKDYNGRLRMLCTTDYNSRAWFYYRLDGNTNIKYRRLITYTDTDKIINASEGAL